MSSLPAWLPPTLSVNPYNSSTEENIYKYFKENFFPFPTYNGRTVWFRTNLDADTQKEDAYVHLTNREEKSKGKELGRVWDPNRASRISWVIPILNNSGDAELREWDITEKNILKRYIWLYKFDFVVILQYITPKSPSRDRSYRLITSFFLDYAHAKEKMLAKYNKSST